MAPYRFSKSESGLSWQWSGKSRFMSLEHGFTSTISGCHGQNARKIGWRGRQGCESGHHDPTGLAICSPSTGSVEETRTRKMRSNPDDGIGQAMLLSERQKKTKGNVSRPFRNLFLIALLLARLTWQGECGVHDRGVQARCEQWQFFTSGLKNLNLGHSTKEQISRIRVAVQLSVFQVLLSLTILPCIQRISIR